MELKERISDYKDFPKKGILFRDFSPILKDPSALSFVVDEFSKKFHPNDVDVFAGIESRGFILACMLAQKYNKGMVLLRKAGKLPGKTVKVSYNIEYGKAQMEIQKTALEKNEPVLIYCRSGNRSHKTGAIMDSLGFNKIYDLKGGYSIWNN